MLKFHGVRPIQLAGNPYARSRKIRGPMSDLLKGNFTPRNPVADEAEAVSLEDQFEVAALKRLGGSITFVAKRKVMWDLAPQGDGGKRK